MSGPAPDDGEEMFARGTLHILAVTLKKRFGGRIGQNRKIAKAVLNGLADILRERRLLVIHGFVTMQAYHVPPRICKNPKTRQRVNVPGKMRIRFKPSPKFAKQCNQEWGGSNDVAKPV